jgi:hypothetical protein
MISSCHFISCDELNENVHVQGGRVIAQSESARFLDLNELRFTNYELD